MNATRPRPWTIITLVFAAVAAVTLFPASPEYRREIACFYCSDLATADAVRNTLLFLPVGLALAATTRRTFRVILLATLASALIEAAQLMLPGRDASVGDILTNAFGASIGVAVVRTTGYWLVPPQAIATALSITSALLASGVVAVTGFLFTPFLPETQYYGQWTPDLTYLEWYHGSVIRARIGHLALPSRRLENSASVRNLITAGTPIEILALAGPSVPRLASLFSIYDEREREIVLVGPDRTDLVLRFRTRAQHFKLDQPDLRLRGALASVAPGDTLAVAVALHQDGWCVDVNRASRCRLGFTPGYGWALVLYMDRLPPALKSALNVFWVGALLLPVGFLAQRRRDLVMGGLLAGTAMVLAAAWTNLLALTPLEWFGAGAGMALGRMAGLSARHATPKAVTGSSRYTVAAGTR